MKSLFALAKRNLKETFRDPLSLIFCLLFPIFMLVLIQVIFLNMQNVPQNFDIQNYASGICVFGFTFTAMFVALQIAGDKNTAFIKRINIAPTNKFVYYLSFGLSALAVAFVQEILFFAISLCFGLKFDANFWLSIIYLIPSAIMYISLGILVGIICTSEKQAGPISSIVVSLVAILGGVFMPLSALKGGFKNFVNLLPFSHSILISSQLSTVGAGCIYPHILYVIIYTILFLGLAFVIQKIKQR